MFVFHLDESDKLVNIVLHTEFPGSKYVQKLWKCIKWVKIKLRINFCPKTFYLLNNCHFVFVKK